MKGRGKDFVPAELETFSEDLVSHTMITRRTIKTFFLKQKNIEGDSVILHFAPPMGGIDLTVLTLAELEAFKTEVDYAYELAKPICIIKDEEAEMHFKNGYTRVTRRYRPDPRVLRFHKPEFSPRRSPDELAHQSDESDDIHPDGDTDLEDDPMVRGALGVQRTE